MKKIQFKITTIVKEPDEYKFPKGKCTCANSSQLGMCKYCADCYSIIYKRYRKEKDI